MQGVQHVPTPPALPTGVAPLDALLGGGLARGALTELLGAPTAGMTTLALTALAHTQARGEVGALLDLRATFDGGYAAACGVALPAFLLVRPDGVLDALALAEALLTSGGVGLLVLDDLSPRGGNDAALLAPALRRLLPAIAPHPGALPALTPLRASRPATCDPDLASPGAHAAALHLHVARLAWAPDSDPPMCLTRVTVVKRRGGTDGQSVELPIIFPDD